MGCKSICSRFAPVKSTPQNKKLIEDGVIPRPQRKQYSEGIVRCTVCNMRMICEKNRCPCCSSRFRKKPKQREGLMFSRIDTIDVENENVDVIVESQQGSDLNMTPRIEMMESLNT